jgi:hypothetical protein
MLVQASGAAYLDDLFAIRKSRESSSDLQRLIVHDLGIQRNNRRCASELERGYIETGQHSAMHVQHDRHSIAEARQEIQAYSRQRLTVSLLV